MKPSSPIQLLNSCSHIWVRCTPKSNGPGCPAVDSGEGVFVLVARAAPAGDGMYVAYLVDPRPPVHRFKRKLVTPGKGPQITVA